MMVSRVRCLCLVGVTLVGACSPEEIGGPGESAPARPQLGPGNGAALRQPVVDAGQTPSDPELADLGGHPPPEEPVPAEPEPSSGGEPSPDDPGPGHGPVPEPTPDAGISPPPEPEAPEPEPQAPEPEAPEPEPTDPGDPTQPLNLDFEAIPLAGVDFITDFAFIPGTNELLATGKTGVVHHLALEGDTTALLGQVQIDGVYDELDCGLISIGLDPDFANNGFVYLGFCTDIRTSGVYRVEWSTNYDEIAGSLAEVISVGAEPIDEGSERPWHNVGALDFTADGVLWVTFGDKTRSNTAQDPTDDLGSLLRIVPNRDPEGNGHSPAPGNPYFNGVEGSPNVYAVGLRSPWRGMLDRLGRYFIGDVGSDYFEEVNVVDAPGQNFGWPEVEGPCDENCAPFLDPVASWTRELDHPYVLDDADANPINGRVGAVGVEYVDRGNDRYATRLTNRVIFSDFCVGWIRALEVDTDRQVVFDQHVGHLNHAAAWRQGADGYLYAVTYGRCQTDKANVSDEPSQLYRAVAVAPPGEEPPEDGGTGEPPGEELVPILDPAVPFPATLSETGVYPFDNDVTRPVEGAIPYQPRSELWSNGLDKERLLLLPEGTRVDTSSQPWSFPPGTVFVKNFSDLNGPIETRFLRNTADGFEYAAYQWHSNGEALLLDGQRNVDVVVETSVGATLHTIPSRLTCRQCHESSPSQVLGFNALQLWSAELDVDPAVVFDPVPELVDPISESDPATRAVLDYFVGNCTHCHNDSVGLASSFDLRPDVALDNIINRPTDSNAAAPGIRVVPGSPEESMLFLAVSGEGGDEDVKNMPPEGVQFRDSEAVEMLRAWIQGL